MQPATPSPDKQSFRLTMQSVVIGNRQVGDGAPALVIAEIAQAHDGSLGFAHAFIDAAASAGADMVKFQTHIAAAESTVREPWRTKFSRQDDTRYDYWRRMEFAEEQWAGLYTHAHQRGLLFSTSPFSTAAVEMIARTGVDAWKVASGQHRDMPVSEAIVRHARPVLISTGMSPWAEIEATTAYFTERNIPFAVMQCTSIYPTPPEKVGLNVIAQLQARLTCPVGLSDHSGTVFAGLAAAALGIAVLEVHVTFDKRMFGPDTDSSVTFDELRMLVDGIRFIERARANPVDKDRMADELDRMRTIFTKSLVATRNLQAGEILREQDIALKKPGGGLTVERMGELTGRRLVRDVAQDQPLSPDDVD